MQPKEILDILDYIVKLELDEVNIETEQFKISVKKHSNQHTQYVDNVLVPKVETSTDSRKVMRDDELKTGNESSKEYSTTVETLEKSATAATKFHTLKSPIIGTYYESSNPESPPFVNVGDVVKKGQTICIIEAMKLFNEIESEVSGKIVEILVENATPVEYDHPLFMIDTA